MAIHPIEQDAFSQQVLQAQEPVLVDFWAPWCSACRALAPVLSQIAPAYPHIHFCSVNVDEAPALAQQYHIGSIPTLILFRGGEAAATLTGAQSRAAIEAMLA